jgi:hypothetical protein
VIEKQPSQNEILLGSTIIRSHLERKWSDYFTPFLGGNDILDPKVSKVGHKYMQMTNIIYSVDGQLNAKCSIIVLVPGDTNVGNLQQYSGETHHDYHTSCALPSSGSNEYGEVFLQ